MRFRNANPVYNKMDSMQREYVNENYKQATYGGVALKSLFYIFITFVGAFLSIFLFQYNQELLTKALIFSVIGGIILSFVAILLPNTTKITGSFYCLFEGLVVGFVSLLCEEMLPGVVLSSLVGTLAVVLVVTLVFLTGLVKVNGKFLKFVITFSLSYLLTYFIVWILTIIFPSTFSNVFSNLGVMLLVSIVVIFLACLYLLSDLNCIKNVVEGEQPKELEWYASFGLIFTVIWLYIEILRILVIIFGSRNN